MDKNKTYITKVLDTGGAIAINDNPYLAMIEEDNNNTDRKRKGGRVDTVIKNLNK